MIPTLRHALLVAIALLLGGSAAAQTGTVQAPLLSRIWRNTSASVLAGEHVAFSFKDSPGTNQVGMTLVRLTDPSGTAREFAKVGGSAGSLVVPTLRDWPVGRYTVNEVQVFDTGGVSVTFRRNGTVVTPEPPANSPIPRPSIQAPTTHALSFAELDFDLAASDGGTAVAGAVGPATRWTAVGSPYRLTGNVVVPSGATLTIEPGAKVIGSAYTIEVAGTLDVVGSDGRPAVLSHVHLLPTNTASSTAFIIRLRHAAMYGGSLWPITGRAVFGTLLMSDSTLVDVGSEPMVIRYPTIDCVIERNVFYHCGGITLGTGGGSNAGIELRNNVFHEPHVEVSSGPIPTEALLLFFAQSGGPITVKGNSFHGIEGFPIYLIASGVTLAIDVSRNFYDEFTLVRGTIVNPRASAGITIVPRLEAPEPATPASPSAPVFDLSPTDEAVAVGARVTLAGAATGRGEIHYQWHKDGIAIPGATSPIWTLETASVADGGAYSLVAGNYAGETTSPTAVLTVSGTPGPRTCWLANVSVRTALQAGQEPLVVGFATNAPKQILMRAAGPALAAYGVEPVLGDPALTLYGAGTSVPQGSNDNWGAPLASVFDRVGAFPFTAGSRDAAMVEVVAGGATAHASGLGAGIVLVEAYDVNPDTGDARLVNVSARNRVGTGDDILIAGFSVQGTGAKRLLIRAVGPTLAEIGVGGVLADPRLEVYSAANALIAANDNWSASLAAISATTGAFPLTTGSRDAAMIVNLPAGTTYSVQVRGADGGTGVALVEVYEVP